MIDYTQALGLQKKLWEHVVQNDLPGVLLLLEHPPVFTLGRSASRENLLVGEEVLRREGIKVYEVERGGDITYHGPGQIVGYPVINLRFWRKDVHAFLRALEETLILFLRRFQIEGFRYPPHTGVWVNPENPEKIAAIGIAVRGWVTYHGFALNISPNLAHFRYIVPCGIRDKGVTSLECITGNRYSWEERYAMKEWLAEAMGTVLGFDMQEVQEDFEVVLSQGVIL
ncbi:MAG: lipoyl(octanoyl) transferase LipB [Candidatus Atribacteria bacterium]|nr:lipoyl(octanoyl) transferase LipB [Candidatus Atribacteria bacterium]